MSNIYSYAQLGESCQTNADVLIDNAKYLSINDPVYKLILTRMNMYPGFHKFRGFNETDRKEKEMKEDVNIKTKQCCGKN